MILKFRNKKPSISFGLGKFNKTAEVGQSVEIYLAQVYDQSEYSIGLASNVEIPSVKVNSNLFRVTPDATGTFILRVNVANNNKSIQKTSNSLTLIVE